MKKLKMIIALFLATVLMLAVLSGCSKHGKCEECGQNEKLNEYTDNDGDIHWYCDNCYSMAKFFGV